MIYASAKLEVATSNGLGDAFTRKYIIVYLLFHKKNRVYSFRTKVGPLSAT